MNEDFVSVDSPKFSPSSDPEALSSSSSSSSWSSDLIGFSSLKSSSQSRTSLSSYKISFVLSSPLPCLSSSKASANSSFLVCLPVPSSFELFNKDVSNLDSWSFCIKTCFSSLFSWCSIYLSNLFFLFLETLDSALGLICSSNFLFLSSLSALVIGCKISAFGLFVSSSFGSSLAWVPSSKWRVNCFCLTRRSFSCFISIPWRAFSLNLFLYWPMLYPFNVNSFLC